MKRAISFILATWFGIGYAPVSGTIASAAALPIAFLLSYYGGSLAILIAAVVVYIIGVLAVRVVLKFTKHDPPIVVIDEIAGQIITFLFVANKLVGQGIADSWAAYLIGFIWFRMFDITKLWPASYFDRRVENASGVMLDDVVAGLYSAVALIFFI